MTVNGVSDRSLSVTVASGSNTVYYVDPPTASPVLKGLFTLYISGFTGTLDKDDLTVNLISSTDSTYIRYLRVTDVSDSTDSETWIQVKYGGALSGTFDWYVHSETYGKFDTSSVSFEAIGVVTDYSPLKGSLYGGTLITITGYNFSTEITDNPVKVGNTDCDVQSSSNTQIICRT